LPSQEESAGSNLQRRIAVLVDGDNAQASLADRMINEVSRYGNPVVRRIYGDWASGKLGTWTNALHEFAFEAAQQHVFVKGKNTTDGRLIIEAMDFLHTSPWIDAFCIVSSDSDYTALAKRLRAGGKWVLGIGERKTSPSFVAACNQFTFTDLLGPPSEGPKTAARAETRIGRRAGDDLVGLLREAAVALAGEDGFANLGQIGQWLRQRKAGFDPREYGRSTVSGLFKLHPKAFEFRAAGGQTDFNWVRAKDDRGE